MAQQQQILPVRSKSGKPKKVPQRGLGVAQLEKIRVEEQMKKEALQAANENVSCLDVHFSCPDLVPFPPLWPQMYGSNPPLLVPQRSYQFQHPVVKTSAGISQTSAVSSTSQIEPPSNQSSCGNPLQPPEERKMVGIKRPYSFRGHFYPTSRSDEFPSCSSMAHKEPRNKYKGELNGDFLTLAPPDSDSKKNKHCLDQTLNFENVGSDVQEPAGPNRFIQREEQSINLFPAAAEMEMAASGSRIGDGEKGDAIDLSLKL